MRFKDFLREGRHREDISLERAEELLNAHCKDALENFDKPLWRGFSGQEEAYLVQGNKSTRTSANSTNHYTVIMDHVLAPQGYPKRSASIILANNKNSDAAEQFGSVFAIFPYDGVKIGVCDGADIWFTRFKIGDSRIGRTCEKWNEFFDDAGIPDYSYEDLVQGIKDTLEDPEDDHYNLVDDVFGSPQNVEELLERAYGPKNLQLHLATSADIKYYEDQARELWIGGKCVAIDRNAWAEMMVKRGFKDPRIGE